jgi:hypothetical protein
MSPLTANGRGAIPIAAALAWLAIVGTAIWNIAGIVHTPPIFDAVSYAYKAMMFWDAVHQGHPFNPLNLPPTFRPPGVIAMAYPFGFTPAFKGFLFRSVYLPVVLLAAATYIAGSTRGLSVSGRWLLAALAVAVASMPALFQFEPNVALETPVVGVHPLSIWGHVDNFLAGVAAIAAAAAVRSARMRSVGWATIAALTAAFCLMIKPAGALVMGIVAVAWVLQTGASFGWRWSEVRNANARGFVAASLAIATIVFTATLGAALGSQYLGHDSFGYGHRALIVLKTEFAMPLKPGLVLELIRDSFGLVTPLVVLGGFVAALKRPRDIGAAVGAAVALFGGLWLLTITSDVGQIRYFVAFGAVAYVLLVPTVLARAATIDCGVVYAAAAVAVVPALATAGLLVLPSAGLAWQHATGISLPSDAYAPELRQGEDFLRQLQDAGVAHAHLYQFDSTPPLYTFAAPLDYRNYLLREPPQVQTELPVDWERPNTFRLENIRQSDYVAFAPVTDAEARARIIARHDVANFRAETALMNAWFSQLSDADGVRVVSETRVRLLQIVDHALLEKSLDRLRDSHDWPAAFTDANPPPWWREADVARVIAAAPVTVASVRFNDDTGVLSGMIVRAATVDPNALGLRARFWVFGDAPPNGWFLFAHLVDAQGNILASTQVPLATAAAPDQAHNLREYTILFARRPEAATGVAFGFYRPGTDTAFLTAQSGTRDWNGKRALLALP